MGRPSRIVNGLENGAPRAAYPAYGWPIMRSVFVLIERRGEAQQS